MAHVRYRFARAGPLATLLGTWPLHCGESDVSAPAPSAEPPLGHSTSTGKAQTGEAASGTGEDSTYYACDLGVRDCPGGRNASRMSKKMARSLSTPESAFR